VMAQMTAAFRKTGPLLLAVQEVPQEHTSATASSRASRRRPLLRIDEIVEKPAPRWPRRAWAWPAAMCSRRAF
jgi:UTP-glucose-1-phosphate uridylyltransferase